MSICLRYIFEEENYFKQHVKYKQHGLPFFYWNLNLPKLWVSFTRLFKKYIYLSFSL